MNPVYERPFNIIIAGVGGQRIDTLTRSIWRYSELKNWQHQGSVFKGGSQTLGSIYSMVRIFFKKTADYDNYSHQILDNDLDLLIGLEPYETLRFNKYFNKSTKIIFSTNIIPLWIERHKQLGIKDPVKALRAFGLETISENYQELAIQKHGDSTMAGYELIMDGITKNLIPFEAPVFDKAYRNPSDISEN